MASIWVVGAFRGNPADNGEGVAFSSHGVHREAGTLAREGYEVGGGGYLSLPPLIYGEAGVT